jgi:hypothetical protein
VDAEFRKLFNASYTDEVYQRYQRTLSERLGPFGFRLAESPVFLPEDLRRKLIVAATGIVEQLLDPARMAKMKKAIPAQWDTPGMDDCSSCIQVDFATVRAADGSLEPKLIELQGFPSLTAMQVIQRDAWAETIVTLPGLKKEWSCWFSGLDRDRFLALAKRTILGDQRPEHVILMDIDPPTQKTLPDFVATKKLFDVDAVCPTTLEKEGKQLYRRVGGKRVPVRRIYNRVVFDELVKKKIQLPFDYREELDVEWTPHPNWFWAWSKYSLPFLDHPAAPKATLVSDLKSIPENLTEKYVLKPLFSFAGAGVNVKPTKADVEKLTAEERPVWCVQEKIAYEPALAAADGGGVKVEVRMMFFRAPGDTKPVLAQNLCRLARGEMLGVDFNKDFTWVGSSVGIWPAP